MRTRSNTIDHPRRWTAETRRRGSTALLALVGSLGLAACGAKASPGPGYDVSYPQCLHGDRSSPIDLPNARSFAIVGFNGGSPKTTNSCFGGQMDWARGSVGDKGVPKAGIYINSANPGQPQSKEWPHSGTYQGQACHGEDSVACASLYGQGLAAWDVDEFKKRYGDDKDIKPEDLTWWIDVESGNSWECNQGVSPLCNEANAVPVANGAYTRNAAVLNGMASELQSRRIKVGIYTNRHQWDLIASNLVAVTPEAYPALRGLATWISGPAASSQEASAACSQPPLAGLGKARLSQFTPSKKGALDENAVC